MVAWVSCSSFSRLSLVLVRLGTRLRAWVPVKGRLQLYTFLNKTDNSYLNGNARFLKLPILLVLIFANLIQLERQDLRKKVEVKERGAFGLRFLARR